MLDDFQSQAELLWASVREVLNIFQAAESDLSLDTVKMFYNDARAAGYAL